MSGPSPDRPQQGDHKGRPYSLDARYRRAMCLKKHGVNSTDSQFYGINKHTQFYREIRVDNLKEKTNWVSVTTIPCFRRMNSLFPRNNFPVRCRTGNRLHRTGIAAQLDARTGRKAPKWSEI